MLTYLRTYLRKFHPVGLAVALVFFTWSLTPSLLPRMWYFQALATGASIAIGYGIGVLAVWIVRWAGVTWTPSARATRWMWWALGVAALILIPLFGTLGAHWQRQNRELIGVDTDARSLYILVVILAVGLAMLLVAAGRGIGRLFKILTNWANGWVPRPVARLSAVALLLVAGILLVEGVLPRLLVAGLEGTQLSINTQTQDGIEQPDDPLRSGSPASLQDWGTLGRDGRTFVGSGPDAAQITAVTGLTAIEPIRVFAGKPSGDTVEEVADNVVAELHRTGAFERKTLAVVTTSGRGWVNTAGAASIEYLSAGDSAIAALQYSYLQSPLAFIADRETPLEAGIVLLDKVYDVWSELPEEDRPQLVVMGESLGSYGAQGAAVSDQDLISRLDGALLIGSPNFSQPWHRITKNRDEGSLERLPVVEDGEHIRFAARAHNLDLGTEWEFPRFVYWQHASDPIVWWSFDLLFNRPDWLAEELGPDVNPDMRWFPVVTFWQVTADMALSAGVPPGFGHAYGEEAIDLWAAILNPPEWNEDLSQRVRAVLRDPDTSLEPLANYR